MARLSSLVCQHRGRRGPLWRLFNLSRYVMSLHQPQKELVGRMRGRGVVVGVSFFTVLLLLLFLVEVMAVCQLIMVVFVCVPVGSMFPLSRHSPAMMVSQMVMIVAMDRRRVRML